MCNEYYSWPDAEEQKALATEFQKRYKLLSAILVADGTTFPLMFRPNCEDAPDYHGQKDGYTITSLIFSDINCKICYYTSGWARSAHDNQIWRNCKVGCNQKDFFSANEYMIGDSAFDNGPQMITTYQAPTGGMLHGSKKKFNDIISSP